MKTILSITLSLLMAVAASAGPVNLELRCADHACVGDTLDVQIVAVGASDNERFCLAAVALSWNPEYLRLDGCDGASAWPPSGDSGGDEFMYIGFPDDHGLGGTNNTFDDGDAYYQAWGNPSEFPVATLGGLVIGTLQFTVLAESEAQTIDIPLAINSYTTTAVYDDQYGGWNICSHRRGGTVGLTSKQSSLGDLAAILGAYGTEDAEIDLDGDGLVGQSDLAIVLAKYRTN